MPIRYPYENSILLLWVMLAVLHLHNGCWASPTSAAFTLGGRLRNVRIGPRQAILSTVTGGPTRKRGSRHRVAPNHGAVRPRLSPASRIIPGDCRSFNPDETSHFEHVVDISAQRYRGVQGLAPEAWLGFQPRSNALASITLFLDNTFLRRRSALAAATEEFAEGQCRMRNARSAGRLCHTREIMMPGARVQLATSGFSDSCSALAVNDANGSSYLSRTSASCQRVPSCGRP